MTTIWKYEIPIADEFNLHMPQYAEILSVQVQNGVPCLWAEVLPDQPVKAQLFYLYGTGHPIPSGRSQKFVGTFQTGPLVFHVFKGEI